MVERPNRSVLWRREIMSAVFTPGIRAWVLTTVTEGTSLRDAMEHCGLSVWHAHGRARWDDDWAAALWNAQMVGRRADIVHGIWQTYERGCDCPECRLTQSSTTGTRAVLERLGPRLVTSSSLPASRSAAS